MLIDKGNVFTINLCCKFNRTLSALIVFVNTLFLFVTGDGRVHKVVQWIDNNGDSQSILLDVFDVTPGEPIQAMEISKEHKALYVASDHRIKQIDLVMCTRRYDNCLRCVHDPYCGWDKDTNTCKPYEPGWVYCFIVIRSSKNDIESSAIRSNDVM